MTTQNDVRDHPNYRPILDHGFVGIADEELNDGTLVPAVMGNDRSIARSARMSYGKGTRTINDDEMLIRYLLRHKHTTPFEMCLGGDTRIPCAYVNGVSAKTYTIKELSNAFESGGKENSWVKLVNIRTVNDDGTIVSTKIKNAWKTGVKKVFRVTDDSLLERNIVATSNHPFLTPDGYKTLEELSVGSEIYMNGIQDTIEKMWYDGYKLEEIADTIGMQREVLYQSLKDAGVDTSERTGFLRKTVGSHKSPRAIASAVKPILENSHCEITGKLAEEIHHLDQDPHNNEIANLVHVSRSSHKAFHNEKYFPNITYIRKIGKIEELEEMEVYDLEVAHDNHNFVAEGFVVHNCEFKFHAKMPIFVARQWVRHRTATINEMSGRYSVLTNEFYIPDVEHLQPQSSNNKQGRDGEFDDETVDQYQKLIAGHSASAYETYEYLLDDNDGIARELARTVLPTNGYTEWYWKANLHNTLNFIRLRNDPHAQYEIRVYAEAMLDLIQEHVPIAVKAFEDYVANSVSFSGMEIELIKEMFNHTRWNSYFPDESSAIAMQQKLGMSKREWTEFKDKFNIEQNDVSFTK